MQPPVGGGQILVRRKADGQLSNVVAIPFQRKPTDLSAQIVFKSDLFVRLCVSRSGQHFERVSADGRYDRGDHGHTDGDQFRPGLHFLPFFPLPLILETVLFRQNATVMWNGRAIRPLSVSQVRDCPPCSAVSLPECLFLRESRVVTHGPALFGACLQTDRGPLQIDRVLRRRLHPDLGRLRRPGRETACPQSLRLPWC